MKSKQPDSSAGRRSFLKGAIGVGGTAAAAAVLGGGVAVAGDEDSSAEEVIAPKSAGYRETAHVRTYYDKARF